MKKKSSKREKKEEKESCSNQEEGGKKSPGSGRNEKLNETLRKQKARQEQRKS